MSMHHELPVDRIHFPIIDSTNTWGKANIHKFQQDLFTIVTADEQTAGRGRHQRKWVSPAHQNLYATICFFVPCPFKYLGNIPQILALAIAEELENLEFTPRLKWPNDILLSKKKVGGILCEVSQLDNCSGIVLGMGINVNMAQEQLKSIDKPATSLFVEGGESHSIDLMLEMILPNFFEKFHLLQEKGFRPFLKEFSHKSQFCCGQKICFHDHEREYSGLFKTINVDGSLTVEDEHGRMHTYHSGELI
jgi:BirA family transcriptional regulator, biotin operon repressor / biotin---[acetyl-CoA-carboxylase] ligase